MYAKFFETMENQGRAGEKLPTGASYALRAWWETERHNSNMFECEDLPFERDMADFVTTLKEAGVKRFAVTSRSTALMENMHLLVSLGCSLEGLRIVTRTEQRFGETQVTKLPAVMFTLS